ncbi:unnamed protein product [Phytophthora fragariaefolia]|uniref:Unnamed protein product n=1 Tax=Phytophthora fragariaefolia TaxID=1490495 RepID=A0A9W6WVN8_9STRA|nr:unnamed protein product [Phytophthora fragariaefolia]
MAKVSKLMRKLFRRDSGGGAAFDGAAKDRGLQIRLRKAVTLGKARQVADLLDLGASPIWMEDESKSRRFRRRYSDTCELNALLIACQTGNVEILSLLLDAFFEEPQVLAHFSRAMYCLVIRHDHWKAFHTLQQRRVPMSSMSSRSSSDDTSSPTSVASTRLLSVAAMENTGSKLPMPIFMASEYGRHHILGYLLDRYQFDWAHYNFEGHSLLSVATINGHYECVRVLLERQVATGRAIDASVAIARRHRQAHVLVLLTSFLPEYASDPEPIDKSYAPPSSNNANDVDDFSCQPQQWPSRMRGRGSIAETVASEFDDVRRSSLLAISSPINYDRVEGGSRVDEMRARAEMHRERRQSGMMWLLDGREPIEEMQRRVDPHGVSSDGFAVLRSARAPAPSSSSSYSSYSQEEESWYAVKPKDQNRKHSDLLADHDDEEENSYEAMFSVHDHEVNNNPEDELPPLSAEMQLPMSAPRSSPVVRSGRSHKLISVRSRGFHQYRQLAAIEEHPSGETEA